MFRSVLKLGLFFCVASSVAVGARAGKPSDGLILITDREPNSQRAETVLFDNGPSSPTSGQNLVSYSIADDFEVSSSAVATGVYFNLADTDEDFASWDGVLRWWLCSDDGGIPGAVLAQGLGVDVVFTPLPPVATWDLYHGFFNLGQSLPLNAGTRYWLALHMNRTWSYNVRLIWNYTPAGHFSPSATDLISFGDWSPSTGLEHAFFVVASTDVTYIFTDGFELADTSIWSATQR